MNVTPPPDSSIIAWLNVQCGRVQNFFWQSRMGLALLLLCVLALSWWFKLVPLLFVAVGAAIYLYEWPQLRLNVHQNTWRILGIIYVLPAIVMGILLYMHNPPWLALVIGSVIAVDTGGYAIGKLVGGPRLCPTISPNKTISGLMGGLAAALGWGIINHMPIVALCAAFSAVGGDLFASWLKRRMGIKDVGKLMGAYGGLIDRFDGYLWAVPIAALCAYALRA